MALHLSIDSSPYYLGGVYEQVVDFRRFRPVDPHGRGGRKGCGKLFRCHNRPNAAFAVDRGRHDWSDAAVPMDCVSNDRSDAAITLVG